jgi:hypothetical protein
MLRAQSRDELGASLCTVARASARALSVERTCVGAQASRRSNTRCVADILLPPSAHTDSHGANTNNEQRGFHDLW